MHILKAVALSALLALAACVDHPTPGPLPPTARPVAIRTCVPGATVTIDGALNEHTPPMTADAFGDVSVNVFGTAFNLHATAPNYPEYGQVVTFTDSEGHQLLMGDCVPLTQPGFQIPLPHWIPLLQDAGERGAVHVDGLQFKRADGSVFPYRGFSAFRLYEQWLAGGAGVIDPVVQDWLTCGGACVGYGPNVLRVFGMYRCDRYPDGSCNTSTGIGWLVPQEQGERFYTELKPFADHLWSSFHVRIEFVIFADAQIIMPEWLEELRHAQRVRDEFRSTENVFLQVANEPFKNIPNGGARAYQIGQTLVNSGPLVSCGDFRDEACQHLDYTTYHTPRDGEWPRKAKDLLDVRDALAHRPVVGDEPMGFAETESGSRSVSPDDAAQFAATCMLFVSGCTYHSDAGIQFGPLGPVQRSTAQAFMFALHWVPADAQMSQYYRGPQEGGCQWVPIGDGPVDHQDAQELRSFAKNVGGTVYAVQIRTSRDHATACSGWQVIEEPRRGFVKLTR